MERNPRIVVVGAGMAGVGTATKLMDLGFSDVTLLEASGEPGGRIAKAHFGKSWIDTGAQYIHGASEANPVYCLLRKSGLLNEVLMEEGAHTIFSNKGGKVDVDFAERVYEAGEGIIRHLEGYSGKSMGDNFATKALELVENSKGNAEEKQRMLAILTLLGKDLLIDIGASDLNKVSLDSWKYFTHLGDDLNIEGKMFRVMDKLQEDFPKDHLLLKRSVNRIDWDGSFSTDGGPLYPVRVVCENGEEILADHVVVTISLGCLKSQASSLFSPQLPVEKMGAVDSLGFGNITKIFLEYEEAFWESDVNYISLIWEEDSPVSVCTNPAQWLKSLHHFTVMRPKERFGNILIGWCTGSVAELTEGMTEEELSIAITEHLRTFTRNPSVPRPKTVLRTQWHSNKFIRGAYTFLPVGIDGLVMDTLAQPLSSSKSSNEDLQVLFAGEATIKTLYSTVHGALLSGHREAVRLAQHYKKTVPSAAACLPLAPEN